ncbi:DUF1499 domain-containing protein [Alisedimentitalea sp. MJ-SS2]|uniref:DUF1499 domain-containing protein n=1 Tax=Aliisedimentitalea sp. MJ-SS2 TaxID=3049795 RepID=UPI002909EB74|nr:DUF1499 domain-containing protein [Alisedimentitalea sp. MJ-SS2]MDU8926553.1 DUF1499 domain-containing protein [Alisedimentitalea sp. MJ-SS2]
MVIVWVFLAVVVLFGAYVRLAPSDVGRWHVPPKGELRDKDFQNGAIRVVQAGPDGLARMGEIAGGWPRTKLLAGSVAEGMVTYVTRTAFWGFPDYTTVQIGEGQLVLYARSRFGRRDMGVNRDRLEAWLKQL